MNHRSIKLLLAVSIAFGIAGGALAEDSKLDPKKPLQDPMEAKMEQGKADEPVTGEDTSNSRTPVVTRSDSRHCDIKFDNRTDIYSHRIYVDRVNRGSLSRYGDGILRDVGKGKTRLYAEADYTDGTTSHWGPTYFDCKPWSTYVWKLND